MKIHFEKLAEKKYSAYIVIISIKKFLFFKFFFNVVHV